MKKIMEQIRKQPSLGEQLEQISRAPRKTPTAQRETDATGQNALITPEIGSALVTFILGGKLDNPAKWRTECIRVLPEIIRRVNSFDALAGALRGLVDAIGSDGEAQAFAYANQVLAKIESAPSVPNGSEKKENLEEHGA